MATAIWAFLTSETAESKISAASAQSILERRLVQNELEEISELRLADAVPQFISLEQFAAAIAEDPLEVFDPDAWERSSR